MKMEEYEYINGNIVLIPQEERNKKEEEEKRKREEERKRYNKKLDENRKYNRKATSQIIGVALLLGIISITLSSRNYVIQKKLIVINSEISSINEINEAMQIELSKQSALQSIASNAEDLGMKVATKDDMVSLDLSQNYFEKLEKAKDIKDESENGFFSKIMDVLF
ncbi:MAG: hypothetical protein SOY42_01025 [Clostridium sp.]|nr:hypothetical protein [Clostridium sp.]